MPIDSEQRHPRFGMAWASERCMTLIGVGLVIIILTVATSISAFAEPITVTAIGHNSQPQFDQQAHMPYANPKAPKGGTLSLYALGTFNSMNNLLDKGTAGDGIGYMYDTLMTGSLNEAFVQYPLLAHKVTYDPDDASWVIYHINPKAKFWDGSAVEADDVKVTYDTILTKGLFAYRSYLSALKDTQVLDKYRVKFVFENDKNKEMRLIVGQLPIFKKESLEADFEKLQLKPLIGSGPYQIGSIKAGRSIIYQRDPNYWGNNLMINQGRFNFDKIKYVYYQSGEIAFEGFKAGQYLFRQENTSRKWATAYQFPAVKKGLVVKRTFDNKNPMQMQAIVMNLRRPLFKDIRVRQAISYAFDFEWMNKRLFYNQYERAESFFHNSELAATGTPSMAEMKVLKPLLPKLEPRHRQGVLSEWHAPKSDGRGYNRENLLKARKLLLQAGFYYQDMQLYQPNGKPAKLELLIAQQSVERILLPFANQLKRLGFDASIRLVDIPQYINRRRAFDYDMMIDGFAQGLSPGQEQQYMWGSQAADQSGNRNTAGIKNPVIDTVIEQLIHAQSREEIVVYAKVLDRLLRSGHYMVPMFGKTTFQVAYWDQYHHPQPMPTNALGLDYWWVDAQAEQKVKTYLKQ